MEKAGEEGDGEAAELSSNVPAGGHFSFVGFGNAFTMAQWRNLKKWLQRDFKVAAQSELRHTL